MCDDSKSFSRLVCLILYLATSSAVTWSHVSTVVLACLEVDIIFLSCVFMTQAQTPLLHLLWFCCTTSCTNPAIRIGNMVDTDRFLVTVLYYSEGIGPCCFWISLHCRTVEKTFEKYCVRFGFGRRCVQCRQCRYFATHGYSRRGSIGVVSIAVTMQWLMIGACPVLIQWDQLALRMPVRQRLP